jgi:gamma-glutamylcyclotransferase (GGCT)/AIG2-like uncharacterized protein YtfP
MNFLPDDTCEPPFEEDDDDFEDEQQFGEGFSKMVDTILRRKFRTPDYPKLCETELHKLFVYGTLMYNCGNNGLLKNSTYLCDGTTVRRDFDMLSFTEYPGVLKTIAGKGHHIMGELYEVDLDTLMLCDILESNGSLYKRELVKIKSSTTNTTHTAWMYVLAGRYPQDFTKTPRVVEWDNTQSWWAVQGG